MMKIKLPKKNTEPYENYKKNLILNSKNISKTEVTKKLYNNIKKHLKMLLIPI